MKSNKQIKTHPTKQLSKIKSQKNAFNSWQAEREKARQDLGEDFFKNRSHEDLIEDFLVANASEAIRTRQLIEAREENSILLTRIESMRKEINQLRQLNEAYGISLDKFFESRSTPLLRRI